MLVFFKVAMAFISDFLVIPASDGRYSNDHQNVPPKWNSRAGWNKRDHHREIQRGDGRRLEGHNLRSEPRH